MILGRQDFGGNPACRRSQPGLIMDRIGVLFEDDIRAGKRIVIGSATAPGGSFEIAA